LKERLLSIAKYFGLLGIGIGLVLLAFRGIDLRQVGFTLSKGNWIWLIPAFGFSCIAHFSRGIRWNMLIESLGYNTSHINSFYAVCIGYLANTAVPRLGEVTRCTILSKTQEAPLDALIGTVVLERIIDVFTVLLLLFALIGIEFDVFGSFFLDLIGSKVGFLLDNWIVFFIGSILISISGLIFIKFWFERLKSLPGLGKLMRFLEGMWTGLVSIKKLNRPFLFIFYSFFIWGMYLLVTLSAFKCLVPTSNLGLGEGLAVLVAGGFGMAAPTPGGIGSYHLLVSEVLTLFNISKPDGLAAATLNHLSQTLFLIILGSLSFLMLFLRKTTK
jgi:uncharacterized protein (TIRG00374 family)